MKRRLMRPGAAFFPLALLISALFGDELTVFLFLLLWYALQITTLAAPEAFRNAAAREPGVRRVGRRFWGGIMQCLLGGALLIVPIAMLSRELMLQNDLVVLAGSAFLIIIEQMFEERMFALSRNVDGTLMSLISNALLTVGLMFTGADDPGLLQNPWLPGCCGAAALIAAVLTFVLAGGKGFTLLPVNCGFAPKAMLQVFLYPAAVTAASIVLKVAVDARHILAGLILWQLSRTVYRRARTESKPLDWLLTVACAVFAILACLHPAFLPYAVCCTTAFVCAAVMYNHPSVRLYLCLAAVTGITALAYLHPFAYLF